MCRGSMTTQVAAASALAGLLLLGHNASAAVTFSGQVTPDDVDLDPVQPTVELRIGEEDEPGDVEDVDPRATVRVNGGDTLSFNEIFVGYDDGFFGKLYASGEGTLVMADETIVVGRQGNGYMAITDGATLWPTDSSADLCIAEGIGSIGEVLVSGASTFVSIDDDVIVGDLGAGRLDIKDDALFRTTDSSSVFIIGDQAPTSSSIPGSGVVNVDGPFTTLQLGDDLIVGRDGTHGNGIGELNISTGALVDANTYSSSLATVGTLGKVTLSGGTLDVTALEVSGYLGGSGVVRGDVDVLATGDVEADAGDLLDFHDEFTNAGAVTITDGEIRLLDVATTDVTGRYTLEDGVLRFSQAHTNDGVLVSAEGTNNIHGEILNNGNVVVASESVAVFNDAYTDAGTTTVLARGNALFLSDLTFTSAALELGLSAEDGVNTSAQMEVAGALAIEDSTTLVLDFDPNLALSSSQTIELIYADGGITGQFVPPVFPNIQGVEFGLLYEPNSVVLGILVDPGTLLDGDFNNDGIVDAADYTVWRDNPGGIYGPEDYLAWRNNYGRVSTPAASQAAVPEPAGLALLALLGLCAGRRRRW